MVKQKNKLIIYTGVVLAVIFAGVILRYKKGNITQNLFQPNKSIAAQFAEYKEYPVNISPNVPDYSINKDLSNIINIKDFELTDSQKNMLLKNGFFVKPSYYKEFFPIYETNRYVFIPNFVTTDSMLHNYHLIFDYLLKKVEEEHLAGILKNLNDSMLSESLNNYSELKGTDFENAAKRNIAFFAVGSKLSTPETNIPDMVKTESEQELRLIEKHKEICDSAVINMGENTGDEKSNTEECKASQDTFKEDYSQYIPRGHYDKTELLKNYFKSMMWYGRMTFRFKNEDEIKSAALITLALNEKDNAALWDKIYEPTNFFVGKSDDIGYTQFKDLMDKIYGKNADLKTFVKDKEKFAAFVDSVKKLEPPQINSVLIFNEQINPNRDEEIKGFRFMGQRFTIDASIFQRLVDREVPKRMLPKALDIPAALGSKEALNILDSLNETKYENYSKNMQKMKDYAANLDKSIWTQNLYWSWMYAIKPLTEEAGAGYPKFMKNSAWTRKNLNTFLGSFTELKHDTVLYAKQVYAELGGGGDIEEKDDRGYVEPNPYLYSRLASLIQMTKDGLLSRELLNTENKENLDKMRELALSLKTISEKELNNIDLTEDEYELIRSYGGQLEHFWLEVNKEEMEAKGVDQGNYLNQNPAAVVTDIATDPNGQVLEEGTGYISEIYTAVPVRGKLKIITGGVYSYYEFPHILSDRLTDEKWREMLQSDPPLQLPDWTKSFIAN